MKHRSYLNFLLSTAIAFSFPFAAARSQQYTVNKNTHSHNDYLQPQPFYSAISNHFYSVEIDVFLRDSSLLVAHTEKEISPLKTIESLYIEPLLRELKLNDGKPYANGDRLQFMIDLKNDGPRALHVLEQKLKPIRHYFDVANNPNAVRIVMSGDVPEPAAFAAYDNIIFFDGKQGVSYSPEQLKRVAFVSAPLQKFTAWNGLGRMVEAERQQVQHFIDSVHSMGKPVRFWGNPDTRTTWLAFMKMGVDYLNTDSPNEMARFLNTYQDNTYVPGQPHPLYTPTYKSDVVGKKPKNIILLISDGAGFSEFWAAATANRGQLNATQIKHIGFSKTNSADDYNTDSGAGATAMSTGKKTRNRFIGMDSLGKPASNIIDKLAAKGIKTGIVSNDLVTGATPASFYAHQQERNDAGRIANDLVNSKVTLLIGGKQDAFDTNGGQLSNKLGQQGFTIENGLDAASFGGQRAIVFDEDRPQDNFHLVESAFDKSVNYLMAQSKGKGFFLMMEGAKIDAGGHSNHIAQCVEEYLSFDKVIGKAMEFADKDGETLVLITSDHETGGLIVYAGNYETGMVTGTFTTTDHTGLPVPLLAYGPGADNFTGFIANNDIALKVLQLLDSDRTP